MAIADRMDNGVSSSKKIICLMSDGELDEGNSWEAIALAGKEKLQNLTVILDRNNIQISGFTEDVMPLEPLPEKWLHFNWHVQEVSGHDFCALDIAWNQAQAMSGRPSIIIAHTISSKGIPDFERQWQWHGKVPTTPREIETARKSLG
jgi:transketolase